MRQVHVGPVTGLVAGLALLTGLTLTVGLGAFAVTSGTLVVLATFLLLEHGMRVFALDRLGPANRVTLVRATLVAGVTALVAEGSAAPRTLLVAVAAVALVLDGVDGQVARRTGSVTELGAAFDMEVDALLILLLSLYVAPTVGDWVMLIGLARYALLLAGAILPWLSGTVPSRPWAKVVAAVQGIVLVVVASGLVPVAVSRVALAVALALLMESFGRQVWTLWRQRREHPVTRASWVGPTLDLVAVGFVWVALMTPHRPDRISPGALLGIPVELLVFLLLAIVLPRRVGRVLAVVGGVVLTATVLLTVLDLGFYEAFDRPFDLLNDPGYAHSGLDTLQASVGTLGQLLVVGGIVLGVLATLALCTWAMLRMRRAAQRSPRGWTPVIGVLGLAWVVAGVGGAQLSGVPVAAAPATRLLTGQVEQVQADLKDRARFEHALAHDQYATTPTSQLLTRLKGKDVLLVFVESYGRVATQGSWFAPKDDAALQHDTDQLSSLGFASRSGYLRSPTFGGISWLAHSTMQTGLWIDSQQRYDQVIGSNRLTLTSAFRRAGWRTVDDVPSNPHGWPQGKHFYHYNKMYGASNVGYQGPRFSYAEVPDQYTFKAFTHNELAQPHRRPVMAEIDLDSSHEPWAPLPHLVPWSTIGNGSIYDGMDQSHASLFKLLGGPTQTQRNYATSVRYAMGSLVSFVRNAHDKKLVMVVLGDHQPATVVSGIGGTHDVPISLVAHDPAVLRRIDGWDWTPGLLPDPHVTSLTMDRFRNRFFQAFDR